MFHIFAGLAEFERNVIRERTMAGLQAARSRGRVGGRKKALTAQTLKFVQTSMREREASIAELAKDLKVSKMTLYRHVTLEGELTEKGMALLKRKAA